MENNLHFRKVNLELVELRKRQLVDEGEICKLNMSICSMHSIVQETANFLVLGVNILILIVPRFITAVVSVWVYNLVIGIMKTKKT